MLLYRQFLHLQLSPFHSIILSIYEEKLSSISRLLLLKRKKIFEFGFVEGDSCIITFLHLLDFR